MVGNMVRGTLKQGMKLWIVTSDRVLATAADRGESPTRPDTEQDVAVASEMQASGAPSADAASADAAAGANVEGVAGAHVGSAVGGPVYPS